MSVLTYTYMPYIYNKYVGLTAERPSGKCSCMVQRSNSWWVRASQLHKNTRGFFTFSQSTSPLIYLLLFYYLQ